MLTGAKPVGLFVISIHSHFRRRSIGDANVAVDIVSRFFLFFVSLNVTLES